MARAIPLTAVLTDHARGLPPPPRMSFSVISTMSPRRWRIITGATCLAVMMRETSACAKDQVRLRQIDFQNDAHCPISGSSPATLSTSTSSRP